MSTVLIVDVAELAHYSPQRADVIKDFVMLLMETGVQSIKSIGT